MRYTEACDGNLLLNIDGSIILYNANTGNFQTIPGAMGGAQILDDATIPEATPTPPPSSSLPSPNSSSSPPGSNSPGHSSSLTNSSSNKSPPVTSIIIGAIVAVVIAAAVVFLILQKRLKARALSTTPKFQ